MKKTYLKRSKKPLRKHRKNKSEIEKLEERADRAIQDFFRSLQLECEVCGRKQEVMHHFIPKSASKGLRWRVENLVKLCNSCHAAHHLSPDVRVSDTIILRRGQEWLKNLEKLRLETKGWKPDKEYLERIIRVYEIKQKKLNK